MLRVRLSPVPHMLLQDQHKNAGKILGWHPAHLPPLPPPALGPAGQTHSSARLRPRAQLKIETNHAAAAEIPCPAAHGEPGVRGSGPRGAGRGAWGCGAVSRRWRVAQQGLTLCQPSLLPPPLFPCRAGTEAGGGSRRCRRGVELPTFLIPDSHSLLDLGSGMSWGRREHHAALGKPPDSPNKTCRGSSPPCEAAQASSPPNASSRGWEAAVPSFLGRDAAGWKGCRAPPARLQTPTQPRGPHAALGDTGLGVLPGPSQG